MTTHIPSITLQKKKKKKKMQETPQNRYAKNYIHNVPSVNRLINLLSVTRPPSLNLQYKKAVITNLYFHESTTQLQKLQTGVMQSQVFNLQSFRHQPFHTVFTEKQAQSTNNPPVRHIVQHIGILLQVSLQFGQVLGSVTL